MLSSKSSRGVSALFAFVVAAGFAVDAEACPKCRLGASALTGFGVGDVPAAEKPVDGHADADSENGSAPSTMPADDAATDTLVAPDRSPLHPLQLSGGVNLTTAYYHRGYLQEDQGVIAQPYLTLALAAYESDQLTVTPYVSWWNSLHDARTFNDGDRDLWYESEIMAGAVFSHGPASLDIKYTLFTYPNGALSQIDEIGAKFSYDLASLWREPGTPADFVLLAWVAVDKELSDKNDPPVPAADDSTAPDVPDGTPGPQPSAQSRFQRFPRAAKQSPAKGSGGGDVSVAHAPIFHQPDPAPGGAGNEEGFDTSTQGLYVELGVEPSFRTRIGKTDLGLSFPVVLGLGGNDYYQKAGGDNDPLGYLQAGVQATVPLPMPGEGKWYLSASVHYLHLFADSLQFANYGEEDEIIATVGVGFAY